MFSSTVSASHRDWDWEPRPAIPEVAAPLCQVAFETREVEELALAHVGFD